MLITHIIDYFVQEKNTEFFDRRTREEKERNERKGEKKKKGIHKYIHIHKPQKYKRTFAPDQLYTHDNIIDELYVFSFVRPHTLVINPHIIVCYIYLHSHCQLSNSMSI